jgi:hypothetical protein
MRPNPHSRALEAILRDLIATRDGATYFAERVWGVSLRYDLGEKHPLVGRSCPDFELANGTRFGTRLQDGIGLLLAFGPHPSLKALDGLWGARVRYVASDRRRHARRSKVVREPRTDPRQLTRGRSGLCGTRSALQRYLPALGSAIHQKLIAIDAGVRVISLGPRCRRRALAPRICWEAA